MTNKDATRWKSCSKGAFVYSFVYQYNAITIMTMRMVIYGDDDDASVYGKKLVFKQTSQELRMLSNVTLNCQETKTVMNSGSQLS